MGSGGGEIKALMIYEIGREIRLGGQNKEI